eukprot:scaffold110924_cov14-Tisochrysis_lutea.AAC.1
MVITEVPTSASVRINNIEETEAMKRKMLGGIPTLQNLLFTTQLEAHGVHKPLVAITPPRSASQNVLKVRQGWVADSRECVGFVQALVAVGLCSFFWRMFASAFCSHIVGGLF